MPVTHGPALHLAHGSTNTLANAPTIPVAQGSIMSYSGTVCKKKEEERGGDVAFLMQV